jgi:hypothetical protein
VGARNGRGGSRLFYQLQMAWGGASRIVGGSFGPRPRESRQAAGNFGAEEVKTRYISCVADVGRHGNTGKRVADACRHTRTPADIRKTLGGCGEGAAVIVYRADAR